MNRIRNSFGKQLPLFLGILLVLVLALLPTGYEEAVSYQNADKVEALVLETNDSAIIDTGLVRSGEQSCKIQILQGRFSGETVEAVNLLNGSLEADKIYEPGDHALVLVSHEGNTILTVSMVDHYRIHTELILAGIFVLFLIVFAGWNGVRAILSFFITILAIWKLLVPAYLNGLPPVWIGIAITVFLTIVIIVFVYGFGRRSLVAILGSLLGTLTTCILGICFTNAFQIHGAIMSNSESLLYSGYQNLNLTQIFMASIFIGASGAMMDLAVDITSAVYEVVQKKPEIGWREAAVSGIHVGKAAMGTMTTTLLLAYSGGYLALLMVFMAQGTPMINILNYKYVASEILDTIVGSFGLVTVAPFTALVSGILLTHRAPEARKA